MLRAAQRLRRDAILDALQAHDRPLLGAGAAHDRRVVPADGHGDANAEQPRAWTRHVEAAVEPVRPAHTTGLQTLGGVVGRRRARLVRLARQSTMSTSTWLPSPAAAALTTVRSACAVRPPRPITLP